jgi:hypothetical protein
MYSDYIPDSLDMLEEYERDRERRHRLYEKQARREEMRYGRIKCFLILEKARNIRILSKKQGMELSQD